MKIDVVFPVSKPMMVIPVDHGYELFSTVSRHLPELHDRNDIFMCRFNGPMSLQRSLVVSRGRLRLRIETDMFQLVNNSLNGKRISIAGQSFVLGAPHIYMIEPHPNLFFPFLLIRFTNKENDLRSAYRREIQHQLDDAGISGASFELLGSSTLEIKRRTLIGFNVVVRGLTDEESLTLQYQGLGGKHSMGCGIPRPDRGARNRKAA